MGARLISIPPNRFFARHTHPNAFHFIYVISGNGIIEYDHNIYKMKPGQTCLVRKGVAHKLGAGQEGLLAIVVNTPTYDNGDPAHVHYVEEETLHSIEID
jgi:quercetin dioxygenase-like cupin family protein